MSHYSDFKDRVDAGAIDDAACILPLFLIDLVGPSALIDYGVYIDRRNFKNAALEVARILDGSVDGVALVSYQDHVHAGRLREACQLLCDIFEGRYGDAVDPQPTTSPDPVEPPASGPGPVSPPTSYA